MSSIVKTLCVVLVRCDVPCVLCNHQRAIVLVQVLLFFMEKPLSLVLICCVGCV